ncbi:MAG: rhodanese-like domain-containing protein [Acidobacteriota bacterium]|nr:rhodanese-like domain-containing protein [Acidobacteriota bacterium]
MKTITQEDLKNKLERGDEFTLIETLPQETYNHAHLPTAINIPPDKVTELAKDLLPDKSGEIVVYCSNPN